MWIGWESLKAATLGGFDAHEFETLVRNLVDIETLDRWEPEKCSIEGPSPPYVQDGDRDVIVTAHQSSHTSAREHARRWGLSCTLLEDLSAGQSTVFTIKTGATYWQSLLDDARTGGQRVLPVLKGGGSLVVVVREALPPAPPKSRMSRDGIVPSGPSASAPKVDPAADRSAHDSLRHALATAYAKRSELAGMSEDALFARLSVLDANDLVQYLVRRRPIELRDALLERLGVRQTGALLDHGRWKSEHQLDRSWPGFEFDPARELIVRQMCAYLRADTRATGDPLVLVGPPGVGKTRVVMEAVERAGAASRAAIGEEVEEVIAELSEQNLLHSAPSVVLVVDDCPVHKIDRVLQRFRRAQQDESAAVVARMVVVVPHGEDLPADEIRRPHTLLRIAPLEREARVALIRQELNDDRVAAVDQSTGGYPWFAVLVACEVRDGAATPRTPTDAARLALASHHEHETDRDCVRRRARALLAVMLAESPSWTDLSDGEKHRLAEAVDLRDRKELDEVLRGCIQRGVLRAMRRWYITPGILEREVWRIATQGTDPGGPLLPRIRRHCPDRLDGFLQRLQGLGFDPSALARDAAPLAQDLAASLRTLDALAVSGAAASLTFCARHAPDLIVCALADVIDRTSLDELSRRAELRRPIVYALASLARHSHLFAPVERALFKLRVSENEAFANNASAVWTWLFLPWINATGVAFEVRLAVLDARCRTGTTAERISAVEGLAEVLRPLGSVAFVGDDSAPRGAPDANMVARLTACWGLSIHLARDAEPTVAAVAQREIVKSLRHGIALGLLDAHADALVEAARGFEESSRVALRREIEVRRSAERVKVFDHPLWERLDRATRAEGFVQRLRERLASDEIFVREAEARGLDETVLAEGLRPPLFEIVEHLDEFERPEASRGGVVMELAGRLDSDAVLRAPLVRRTRERRDASLVAPWARGQWAEGRRDGVRALVEAWSVEPPMASVAVELMAWIGFDDAWMNLAAKLVGDGAVHEPALRAIEVSSWEGTSVTTQQRLFEALLECGARAALRVVLARFERTRNVLDAKDLDLLERALRETAKEAFTGHSAWTFFRCGALLLDAGRARAVCEAVIAAAGHEALPGDSVWTLIEECVDRVPDVFWEAMERVISTPAPEGGRLLVRLSFRTVAARLPVEPVMRWVDHDERRGRLMASILSFSDDVPSLARALLRRFGASSSIGRALGARLGSTPRTVSSLAEFYRARHAQARRWAEDPDASVRAWATIVADELRLEQEAHAEDEALERRRYGT